MARRPLFENHDWLTVVSGGAEHVPEEMQCFQEYASEATVFLTEANKVKNIQSLKSGPIFTSTLPFPVLDVINSHCLLKPIRECYDTHGGVDKDGKLKDTTKSWTIQPEYSRMLISLALRNDVLYQDVLIADQSFRMKQLRGFKWTLVSNGVQAMLFLCDTATYEQRLYYEERHERELHLPPIVFRNSKNFTISACLQK